MPDVSVVTPAAVVPADRLTLGATDARAWPQHAALPAYSCNYANSPAACMAEE
jgi:hypothetical protein